MATRPAADRRAEAAPDGAAELWTGFVLCADALCPSALLLCGPAYFSSK
jgi:hypothetical protein